MIVDRNIKAGDVFAATYRGTRRTVEAKEHESGMRFVLDDGKEVKSLSSAGSAVMGGIACNGWRFWAPAVVDIAKASPAAKAKAARKPKAPVDPSPAKAKGLKTLATAGGLTTAKAKKPTPIRKVRQVKPARLQADCPPGERRYFCSACMAAFCAPIDETVTACPQGHEVTVVDDTAPIGAEREVEREMSEAGV